MTRAKFRDFPKTKIRNSPEFRRISPNFGTLILLQVHFSSIEFCGTKFVDRPIILKEDVLLDLSSKTWLEIKHMQYDIDLILRNLPRFNIPKRFPFVTQIKPEFLCDKNKHKCNSS
jgi:hypothetical protein